MRNATPDLIQDYERDARRYRALRDSGNFAPGLGRCAWALSCGVKSEDIDRDGLDAAADALISAEWARAAGIRGGAV